MSDAFRLLYFGLPVGALALIADGHDVAVVGISRPDAPGMWRLRRCMAERGRLLLVRPELEDASIRAVLASTRASLLVSWFWTKKIPESVLAMAPKAFGVHPSLLPRHRGADPYFWTLAHGDDATGVTAHELTPEYDDGGILSQVGVPVPPGCNAYQLARALDAPSLSLLRELVGRIAQGEKLSAIPQAPSEATDAPAPGDDDCEILWEWSVDKVLARIRAAAPEPGAFTGFGDETVVLLAARRANVVPEALEPGDIVRTTEGVLIRAADGGIVIERARREGDTQATRDEALFQLFAGVPEV